MRNPNPAIKSLIFVFASMLNASESTLDLLQKNSKSRVDSLAFNIDAKTKIKLLIAGFGLRITLKF